MSHHVLVALPDGRTACADYRHPVVSVMHRINKALSEGKTPGASDYAQLAEWLDYCPDEACPPGCNDGPEANHPPATRDPAPKRRYRRPQAAILADRPPGTLL